MFVLVDYWSGHGLQIRAIHTRLFIYTSDRVCICNNANYNKFAQANTNKQKPLTNKTKK